MLSASRDSDASTSVAIACNDGLWFSDGLMPFPPLMAQAYGCNSGLIGVFARLLA